MTHFINNARVGRFTSSEIGRLMTSDRSGKGLGKPALTYIEEKRFERKLMRALDNDISSRPTTWGKVCERYMLEKVLPIEYRPCSDEPLLCSMLPDGWCGTPDAIKYDGDKPSKLVEIKCPFTLKSFCQLAECASFDGAREVHDKGEEYFWQVVSNAVITGIDEVEFIFFVPYLDELPEIIDIAKAIDGADAYKYYWIVSAAEGELPYILRESQYKNINVLNYTVTPQDKEALITRVFMAYAMLS